MSGEGADAGGERWHAVGDGASVGYGGGNGQGSGCEASFNYGGCCQQDSDGEKLKAQNCISISYNCNWGSKVHINLLTQIKRSNVIN